MAEKSSQSKTLMFIQRKKTEINLELEYSIADCTDHDKYLLMGR